MRVMSIESTAGIVYSVGDVKKYALRMPLKQIEGYRERKITLCRR